jgi:hypothetical protein
VKLSKWQPCSTYVLSVTCNEKFRAIDFYFSSRDLKNNFCAARPKVVDSDPAADEKLFCFRGKIENRLRSIHTWWTPTETGCHRSFILLGRVSVEV